MDAIVTAVLYTIISWGLPLPDVEYVPAGQGAYIGTCTFTQSTMAAPAGVVVWCPADNKILLLATDNEPFGL